MGGLPSIDVSQVPRDELAPPKEKLSQYPAASHPDILRYILLTRILYSGASAGGPSVDQTLKEEYFVSLNKILQAPEGRQLFVDVLSRAVSNTTDTSTSR